MVEVVFSDSACGGLKHAQHFGSGSFHGSIGVIVSHSDGRKPTKGEIAEAQKKAEEQARVEWENATPLGGSAADVFGFNIILSVGDIDEDLPGPKRLKVMEWLLSIYPDADERNMARKLLRQAQDNLETIRGRAAAGESIRIWYSQQPDELCGLYWLMAMLDDVGLFDGQVSYVSLPTWTLNHEGNLVQYASWGEVSPGGWHMGLSSEKPAPLLLCKSYAEHWRQLRRENAPLRASLNGQLVSMPETLYDEFLLSEIALEKDEFQEAMVLGRVLGKHPLGIGDAWLAHRIENMVRQGKLEAASEPVEDKPLYHRMLRKTGR